MGTTRSSSSLRTVPPSGVCWPRLRRDDFREPVLAVGEDGEEVAGCVAVDTDREEAIDDQQVRVGELAEQFLVSEPVAAGDDEPPARSSVRA